MRKRFAGMVAAVVAAVGLFVSSVSAIGIGDTAFQRLWDRQDLVVSQGGSDRSWTWGPGPISEVLEEKLIQGVGGNRRVQYFDKSRMEINDPNADSRSDWYVTNGLLPIELITGKQQTGYDYSKEYEMRGPARISAIGDPGNFPTYADLLPLYQNPGTLNASELNKAVTRLYNAGGNTTEFTDYSTDQNTILVQGDNGHGIAQGFLNFMNQEGVVYINGQSIRQQLYSPVFVFGLPVTEPYWVKSKVGGKDVPILFQVFERRVLTYNPANQPAFRVEMGNVGQHYYQWRYGSTTTTPTSTPATVTPSTTTYPAPTATP